MPPFVKSPPELVARFETIAERHPEAQRRKMFGYPALFVGGNLVTGLFADRWMIRLAPDDLSSMLELLEPFRGRRALVVRLLELSGIQAPRYGPRLAPRRIDGI